MDTQWRKVPYNKSASCPDTNMDENYYDIIDSVQSSTNVLHKELCTFTKSSSMDLLMPKPLPLARQLMHKRTATNEESVTNEHQTILNMTRSLETLIDCNQQNFIHQTFTHSDSNISANVLSSAPLQAPLTTSDTENVKAVYDAKAKSNTVPKCITKCKTVEGIYDELASPKHYTLPKG